MSYVFHSVDPGTTLYDVFGVESMTPVTTPRVIPKNASYHPNGAIPLYSNSYLTAKQNASFLSAPALHDSSFRREAVQFNPQYTQIKRSTSVKVTMGILQ